MADFIHHVISEENLNLESDIVKKALLMKEELVTSEKGAVHIVQVNSHEDDRFKNWLNALKIRYWINFGNQEAYRVDWQRKTDSSGNLCEIVIQLFQVAVNGKSTVLMFTISVYITKLKFMVQGKFRELWRDNEFPKLRDFVEAVCGNDLTNTQISEAYSKVFYCEKPLMLDGVCLDAFEDNSEYEEEVVDNDIPNCIDLSEETSKNNKKKSPKKKGARSKTAPTNAKQKPETKIVSEISKDQLISKLIDRIDILENKLSNVENVVTKLQSQICDNELLMRDQIDNTVLSELSSFKAEIVKDLQAQRKNEVIVSKSMIENSRQEVDEALSNNENCIKRMQGRLGSLVEEKGKLEQKVYTLQDQFNRRLLQI